MNEGTFPNSLFPDWIAPPAPAAPPRKGHAAAPGGGPAGETCRTCAHRVIHVAGSGNRFQKCGLVKWTHGAATDIRARDAACTFWEALDGEAE